MGWWPRKKTTAGELAADGLPSDEPENADGLPSDEPEDADGLPSDEPEHDLPEQPEHDLPEQPEDDLPEQSVPTGSADVENPAAPVYYAAQPGDERSQDDMNSLGAYQQEAFRTDLGPTDLAGPLDPSRRAAHDALDIVDAAGSGPAPAGTHPAGTHPASTHPASTYEVREANAGTGEAHAIHARDVITLPAPLVLVGNPRLGSNPTGLPRVPGATPDSVLDGARLANLTVRAASLRGDDHRHAGETRQDSVGLWVFDPPPWLETDVPVLLACVADGVGSQRLSHLGSAKACSLLRQSVEANLNHLVGTDRGHTERNCRQVIRDVATGLRALAADRDIEPKQVSTTLVACLVVTERKADEGALARAALFRVGDSAGYLLRERRWLAVPDRAEGEGEGIIDTHTDALPTARPDRTQFTTCTLFEDDMLMLCTDGLGGPFKQNIEVREQLADWWTGMVPTLPEFYWQMSFRAQTYGDDRSAVCIWLHGNS